MKLDQVAVYRAGICHTRVDMPTEGLGLEFVPNVVDDVAKFDFRRGRCGRPSGRPVLNTSTRQDLRFGSAFSKCLLSVRRMVGLHGVRRALNQVHVDGCLNTLA